MKYIVIPAEELQQIPVSRLEELGLSPRYSTDGTSAIMKVTHFEQLFPSPMTLDLIDKEQTEPADPVYPFPVYDNPSSELDVLLNSQDWTCEEVQS